MNVNKMKQKLNAEKHIMKDLKKEKMNQFYLLRAISTDNCRKKLMRQTQQLSNGKNNVISWKRI